MGKKEGEDLRMGIVSPSTALVSLLLSTRLGRIIAVTVALLGLLFMILGWAAHLGK